MLRMGILKALLAAQWFVFDVLCPRQKHFIKFGMGQQELNHNAVTLMRLEFTTL